MSRSKAEFRQRFVSTGMTPKIAGHCKPTILRIIWLANADEEPDHRSATAIREFVLAHPQIKKLMISSLCESTLTKAGMDGSIQAKIKGILSRALAPQVCFKF
jgi:hypothetical protein